MILGRDFRWNEIEVRGIRAIKQLESVLICKAKKGKLEVNQVAKMVIPTG